ncbi:MAG: hypothetical protein J5980_07920 [Muribaculaceae bacterium]|nr:hypothetical protein [Muribaculaceae bacterium]
MNRIILNILLSAISALSFLSCNSYSKTRVKFTEIDLAIQDTMMFYSKHFFSLKEDLINFSSNYVKIDKQDNLLPWVYHTSIMNVDTGRKYNLDLGTNQPYVIKDGYLYIPEVEDILFCDTINKCYFIKIKLP